MEILFLAHCLPQELCAAIELVLKEVTREVLPSVAMETLRNVSDELFINHCLSSIINISLTLGGIAVRVTVVVSCVCVCVCVCARARARACVRVCVISFLPPRASRLQNMGTYKLAFSTSMSTQFLIKTVCSRT